MPERNVETPIDRPTTLIDGILHNSTSVHTLIVGSQEQKAAVLDRVSTQLKNFDDNDSDSFFKLLLKGLGTEDKIWDQNRRDAALEILPLTPFEKIPKENILKEYLNAVSTQDENSDPYGTISSLIEAGKKLAPFFPTHLHARFQINYAWEGLASIFTERNFQDYLFIYEESSKIKDIVPPMAPEDQQELTAKEEDSRDIPDFEAPEEALHDIYLETVKTQRTFKLTLWANTPNFRALSSEQGIELEKFWNINNPGQIADGLGKIRSEKSRYIATSFGKALRETTGLPLDEITTEQARVVSDEIVKAGILAVGELRRSPQDFNKIISRFREIIAGKENLPMRTQNTLLRPIVNFLKENGLNTSSNITVSQLAQILNEEGIMTRVKEGFDTNQKEKDSAAETIEQVFNLSEKTGEFSLMSRAREDLFLGDLTGDCTAYHLYAGINAWTVPVWLSNPGFNFFKINDKGKLAAKLGILLAVADNQPVLVIDSMEVASGVEDENSARQSILKGFKFLKEWTKSIGLTNIFIQNITNSSDLMPIIDDVSKESDVENLYALGGLEGVSELRQNLLGKEEEEKIYLQSAHEAEDYDYEDLSNRELLEKFETIIRSTIQKAKIQDKDKINRFAREQNWDELFKFIINVNFPLVSKIIGNEWSKYKEFMTLLKIVKTKKQNWWQAEEDVYLVTHDGQLPPVSEIVNKKIQQEMENIVTQSLQSVLNQAKDLGIHAQDAKDVLGFEQEMEELEEEYVNDPRKEQAKEADKFLEILKQMEYVQLTPELALQKLYGQTIQPTIDSNKPLELRLSSRMPILAL